MSEVHDVGPRIELSFPVLTEAGFPHGLRCGVRHRAIDVGQPYAEQLTGVCDNGDVFTLLTCVYCTDEA